MKCKFCSETVTRNPNTPCPKCGAEGDYIDRSTVTQKDFFKYIVTNSTRQGITAAAVITYIAAFFGFFANIILGLGKAADASGDKAVAFVIIYLCVAVVSAAFYVIMGILIQTKRSRVAAVILLVYATANFGYTIVSTGSRGGAAIFGAAILAVVFTFKFAKEFEQYKSGADLTASAPPASPQITETPVETVYEEPSPVEETAPAEEPAPTEVTDISEETVNEPKEEDDDKGHENTESAGVSNLESIETENIDDSIPTDEI